MKRTLLRTFAAAAAAAALSASGFAVTAAAQSDQRPTHAEIAQRWAEAALDAQLKGMKTSLRLTDDQEKGWAPFESAVKDGEKARALALQREQGNNLSAIDRLNAKAERLAQNQADLEKVVEAAKPLYASLSDAQKHKFVALGRMLVPERARFAMEMKHLRVAEGDRHGAAPSQASPTAATTTPEASGATSTLSATASAPDATSPEASTPSAASPTPAMTTPGASGATSAPSAGASAPDAASPEANETTSMPNGASPTPAATTPGASGATSAPSATAPAPDAAETAPNGATAEPGGAASAPSTTTPAAIGITESAPEAAARAASGATAEPSVTASVPTPTPPADIGATSAPTGVESRPSGAPAEPGATAEPSGTASGHGAAASAASGTTTLKRAINHASVRHDANHSTYHSRRYGTAYGRNPVAAAVRGVFGGVADLGSLAAYPVYCFPHYSRCHVFVPY